MWWKTWQVFYSKFPDESEGGRILKFGKNLTKLRPENIVGFFDSQCRNRHFYASTNYSTIVLVVHTVVKFFHHCYTFLRLKWDLFTCLFLWLQYDRSYYENNLTLNVYAIRHSTLYFYSSYTFMSYGEDGGLSFQIIGLYSFFRLYTGELKNSPCSFYRNVYICWPISTIFATEYIEI